MWIEVHLYRGCSYKLYHQSKHPTEGVRGFSNAPSIRSGNGQKILVGDTSSKDRLFVAKVKSTLYDMEKHLDRCSKMTDQDS
jgi:hypothetical protein